MFGKASSFKDCYLYSPCKGNGEWMGPCKRETKMKNKDFWNSLLPLISPSPQTIFRYDYWTLVMGHFVTPASSSLWFGSPNCMCSYSATLYYTVLKTIIFLFKVAKLYLSHLTLHRQNLSWRNLLNEICMEHWY